jgi:hypothetical protein
VAKAKVNTLAMVDDDDKADAVVVTRNRYTARMNH